LIDAPNAILKFPGRKAYRFFGLPVFLYLLKRISLFRQYSSDPPRAGMENSAGD